MKKLNALHKSKKDNYRQEKTKEKMEFNIERTEKFIEFKNDMKNKRLFNQTESLLQREKIREALRQMAVWNVYDVDLVKSILEQDKNKNKNNKTIEGLIRQKAGFNSRSQSHFFASVSTVN